MKLKTLGGLKLEGSDFQRAKALLLVTYLVLEGEQDRRHLADLFWQGSSKQLHNLSMTLTRLRQAGEDLVNANDVSVASHVASDVLDLQKAFQADAYEDVIKLYTGPFLEGIATTSLGIELEEWVYQQREYYAGLARDAFIAVAKQKAQAGTFKEAALQAAEAYHLRYAAEPEAELLECLYLLLQADAHLLAKEVKKEAASFGLELELSQEEAKVKLQLAKADLSEHEGLDNLPSFPTSFIGRSQEINQLGERLRQEDTRLVSIVAQGGMGKTRLAVEAGKALSGKFKDGVCFVSFVSTPSVEQMLYTLGDALNYSFLGKDSPKEQLLNFLKDKEHLLILDNLEHLLSGVSFIHELVLIAPKLKVLATSREALHLQAEYVFDLEGLNSPGDSAHDDALKLFEQRAQMQQASFGLNDDNHQDVSRICSLLEGMPLAIELAASWLRVLALKEIISEITQSLDFLEASNKDIPERHSSMRAVFNYSWELLSSEEQDALINLAIFQGGFTRETAKDITNVKLTTLASLIDKSFLNATGTGRYRRHPLVIQYSREKLAQFTEKQQLAEKHSQYFLSYIREQAPKLRTLERKDTLQLLEPDFPNIKTAWNWVIKEQRVGDLADNAQALSAILGDRFLEAEQLFAQVVTSLDESNPEHHQALGYALVSQSLSRYIPHFTSFEVQRGLDLLKRLDDKVGIIMGLKFVRIYDPNDSNKQQSPFQEGLILARQYGNSEDVGTLLGRKMLHEREFGEVEQVKQHFQEAIKEVRELGDVVSTADLLLNFGAYLVYEDQVEEGLVFLMESLELNRGLGTKIALTILYNEIGYAEFSRGDYEQALNFFNQANILAKDSYYAWMEAKSLSYLGRIAVIKADQAVAKHSLHKSLQLIGSEGPVGETLVGIAEYLNAFDEPARAVTLLQFIYDHPNTPKRDRSQANKLLVKLKEEIPEESFEAALQNSKSLELEGVFQEALILTR